MTGEISLRPATRQDLDRMYQWRNDPDIYRWFRGQDTELDWHSHVEWFQNRPPDREDLIIEHRGTPVGVVSLASDGDVGIYIGEKHLWDRGIAKEALEIALEERDGEYHAEIHVDNSASKHLFKKVGFEEIERDGDWIQFEYRSNH